MKHIAIILAFASTALAQNSGQWTRTGVADPMDGITKVEIQTQSTDHPGDALVIRYTVNKSNIKNLEIFFTTDSVVALADGFLDAYNYRFVNVRTKLDSAGPEKHRWTRSEDGTAVFASHPDKLLAQLKSASELHFEYSPSTQVPQTVTFDIQALSGLLDK